MSSAFFMHWRAGLALCSRRGKTFPCPVLKNKFRKRGLENEEY